MKKKSNISAAHIVSLRQGAKLTQQQLASAVSELTKRDTPYTVPIVSAWETGRRSPTAEVVKCMAELFGVTEAYILGNTEDKKETSSDIAENTLAASAISYTSLYKYDGLPVYATFPNKEHKDQWGIVDYKNDKTFIITRAGCFDINTDFECVIYPRALDKIESDNLEKFNPLGIIQIVNSRKPVYVNMLSADREIRSKYNGWYNLTGNNMFLQGDKGLVLPISGLGILFKCYADFVVL